MGRGREAVDGGAPSVYVAPRAGHGIARAGRGFGERSEFDTERGARIGLRRGAEWDGAWLRIDSYSPSGYSGKDFQSAGYDRRTGSEAFRLLPGSIAVWHAAARRHRAGTGPHRDDPGRSREPARSNSIPEDRAGGGLDVRRTYARGRSAVEGFGDFDQEVSTRTKYGSLMLL